MRKGMWSALAVVAILLAFPAAGVSKAQGGTLNMIAWEVPAFLAVWFGASLFADDFRHFGVKVDGRIVSTGAMYVTDGLAWLGLGATLPGFRGRGMQTAVLARRVHEAAVLGCRVVHSETAAHTPEGRNPSLDNLASVGFEHGYDKQWWSYAATTGTA